MIDNKSAPINLSSQNIVKCRYAGGAYRPYRIERNPVPSRVAQSLSNWSELRHRASQGPQNRANLDRDACRINVVVTHAAKIRITCQFLAAGFSLQTSD